ncbi:MAG: NADH-quinone oxidoreductase subunit J [delta proteobacterium MLS_D]|jgi:multicomponent Na+:H+ antiporter subunit C|nr:MAG: NADH-quinone oxidoreductase subunit J [delta proteobacterium MLS_D]
MAFFLGHYAYWFIIALLLIGFYAIIFKRNLVKQIIGLSIFQTSIILFWVASAVKWNATVPIYDPAFPLEETANYINPLPHTLMLTAIVVGVATLGVAFALLITIYKHYKTLDEEELIKEMKRW